MNRGALFRRVSWRVSTSPQAGDAAIILVVLLFSVSGMVFLAVRPGLAGGERRFIEVSVGGRLIQRLALSENRGLGDAAQGNAGDVTLITVPLSQGEAEIELQGGRARLRPMPRSICPRGICSRMGWISRPGQAIVCAPNRLVVAVTTGPRGLNGFSVKSAGKAAPLRESYQEERDGAILRGRAVLLGTVVEISVPLNTSSSTLEKALSEMRRVEETLSSYDPGSMVSSINVEAVSGAGPVKVSPEAFSFLKTLVKLGERTGGAFDATSGALSDAWGFSTGNPHIPSRNTLARALSLGGAGSIQLDAAAGTVRLREGARLDPSAALKGYAVDRAASILEHAGVNSALISAGGSSIRAVGLRPDGEPWTVAIKHPRRDARSVAVLQLEDASLATSGDYENFFYSGGKRYSHIIDPSDGDATPKAMSVTVVAKDATMADALSTALFVMGPTKARRWVGESGAPVGVLVVDLEGRTLKFGEWPKVSLRGRKR